MTALRTALLAAALLSAPTLALAQTAASDATPVAPATTTAAPAATTPPPAPAGSDAANDRIGVAKALEAAKGRIDGGILEAELESDDGETIWEIDVASGDSVHEVKVNAATGAVISADEKTIEGTWRSWFDADSLADSQRIAGTLAATIGRAEGGTGGRITSVELDEDDNSKLIYEIDVVTADGEADMILDPETGTVTPDE